MVINYAISFLLEIMTLIYFGWAPFILINNAPLLFKALLSILFVMLLLFVWARFAAPRASQRLHGTRLIILKIIVFALALTIIAIQSGIIFGMAAAAIVAINLALEFRQPKDNNNLKF